MTMSGLSESAVLPRPDERHPRFEDSRTTYSLLKVGSRPACNIDRTHFFITVR